MAPKLMPSLLFFVLGAAASLGFNSSAWSQQKQPMELFGELLKEYKRFPNSFSLKLGSPDTGAFESINAAKLAKLPPKVLEARMNQYNESYATFLKIEKKLEAEVKKLNARLAETPLSDTKNRGDLEIKNAAISGQYEQARITIYTSSINANNSILEAMNTMPKALVSSPGKPPPKTPGVMGGSLSARVSQNPSEKINLTPVDDSFYSTQLGKKLETDLGGKADYWSYDYTTDDLYVRVGNDLGRLSVFQDQGGIRYIRTRVGSGFSEPKSADTKVDMLQARGRFLLGDKSEETLFGPTPDTKVKTVSEELPPGHSAGDGHDHSHK